MFDVCIGRVCRDRVGIDGTKPRTSGANTLSQLSNSPTQAKPGLEWATRQWVRSSFRWMPWGERGPVTGERAATGGDEVECEANLRRVER